jgi:hypothetical protein
VPALTNFPFDPLLDLAPWVGQRQASFRFQLFNRVTGENLGEINPIRDRSSLSHNTSSTIKRQVNLALGLADSAEINPITDGVTISMYFPNGQTYPLGRYVFSDASFQRFTNGQMTNAVLNDEMYIVDQQIEQSFSTRTLVAGSDGGGFATAISVVDTIVRALANQPVQVEIAPSQFYSNSSWAAGARRGTILESLALIGNYFSPWFGNDGVLHFIQAFNPATQIPDFDWDAGYQVIRADILETNNLLNAPNRFIVVSNSPDDTTDPTFGVADVPVNAPHSIENRGFVVPQVTDLQALTPVQCTAIAENLVQRQSVFEVTTLTTAPDPRHDSYNVIKWQGELWLELGWTMPLIEGEPMAHSLRKAFR